MQASNDRPVQTELVGGSAGILDWVLSPTRIIAIVMLSAMLRLATTPADFWGGYWGNVAATVTLLIVAALLRGAWWVYVRYHAFDFVKDPDWNTDPAELLAIRGHASEVPVLIRLRRGSRSFKRFNIRFIEGFWRSLFNIRTKTDAIFITGLTHRDGPEFLSVERDAYGGIRVVLKEAWNATPDEGIVMVLRVEAGREWAGRIGFRASSSNGFLFGKYPAGTVSASQFPLVRARPEVAP